MSNQRIDSPEGPPLDQHQAPVTQPRDEDEQPHPVAVLWLFDPEQPHGMREYYIHKAKPKAKIKPMGYGRKDKK